MSDEADPSNCPECGHRADLMVQSQTYRSSHGYEHQSKMVYWCSKECTGAKGKRLEWVVVGKFDRG